MAQKETILVTGATGFIGGWLVEAICLGSFAEVRAGIKSWPRAARLSRFPVKVVPCDVMDKEQITQAMSGVTRVIHCATGSSEVIIQGASNMLEVAQRLEVKRFVHLSTTEVYGEVTGDIDETVPYQYTGSAYGDSKIDAEKLCWEYHKKGLPITVIRPSAVYGPFSKDWTVRIARSLRSGNWGLFKGIGEGVCNPIYIADLIAGVLLAARDQAAVGEAFNLSGPELLTWNEYFQRFNSALRLPELRVTSPKSIRFRANVTECARYLAKFVLAHFEDPLKGISRRIRPARVAMKFAETTFKTSPRLEDLSFFSRDARYLTTKLQNMLGYNPRFDVATGLELTVLWLKHVGLVLK